MELVSYLICLFVCLFFLPLLLLTSNAVDSYSTLAFININHIGSTRKSCKVFVVGTKIDGVETGRNYIIK
jgi:hypothetical protein